MVGCGLDSCGSPFVWQLKFEFSLVEDKGRKVAVCSWYCILLILVAFGGGVFELLEEVL